MNASKENILEIKELHKYFGKLHVLKGIDLNVKKGETVVITGASGSGKSTLLRCLNFLEMPSSGKITIKKEALSFDKKTRIKESLLCRMRLHFGMVFQQFNLFPHMSVIENTAEGLVSVLKMPKKKAVKIAADNLKKVGLEDKIYVYPAKLSGGQQQRVAIARALSMSPDIMLFDEPTSALDPELVSEVLGAMRGLSAEGMTMLIVTHELGFAYAAADRVIFIHNGLIHEQGSPGKVLRKPERQRTKEFLAGFSHFNIPDIK
jgi:polar amino acid transport system ATP-binding protein